ncbi:uncharacterized protein K444DRAFT_383121 [Hyaloscypha bicolor E]|uniref:Secreted protein n=1 Tax=Hyaloscypha bicolor E TaxID=1095630 RepID=A0A2J6TD16_9HELO|nr:uncharacterized protein K444DRAFT_383121 [Hyaloscypha bicolor E]PMD60893.1 hypothetical protein K444DRAFT_383121 [Hyaloscypha bicolor E]
MCSSTLSSLSIWLSFYQIHSVFGIQLRPLWPQVFKTRLLAAVSSQSRGLKEVRMSLGRESSPRACLQPLFRQ